MKSIDTILSLCIIKKYKFHPFLWNLINNINKHNNEINIIIRFKIRILVDMLKISS